MNGTYLGQNFLKEKKYIDYILQKINQLKENQKFNSIIEIGPGKGVITKKLLAIFDNFFVFEKDKENLQDVLLKIVDKSNIVWGDVLEQDIKKFVQTKGLDAEKTLIFGNLPYYITSPILKKFFVELDMFECGMFMVQKEVGDKIKSETKKKSYLWWLLNYGYSVDYLKTVPAKAFSPEPKVDSCLICLSKNKLQKDVDFGKFAYFLEKVSPYKRKTLSKIVSILSKKNNTEFVEKLNLSEEIGKKRLEELSWADIKKIIL